MAGEDPRAADLCMSLLELGSPFVSDNEISEVRGLETIESGRGDPPDVPVPSPPLVSSLRTQVTVRTWLSMSCLSLAQGVCSDSLAVASALE